MSHAAPYTPALASAVFKNFAASLLPFLVTVLTAFVVIPEEAYADPATLIQFAGLIVQTAIALLVPLVRLAWRGALKTGLSLVAAALTGVLTFIIGDGFSVANVVLVVISVLAALSSELGVQIRTAPTPAPEPFRIEPGQVNRETGNSAGVPFPKNLASNSHAEPPLI